MSIYVAVKGDGAKLYLYNFVTQSWIDASRTSGGPYATPEGSYWSFQICGSHIIAINEHDCPQILTIGQGMPARFENLVIN